MRLLRPALLSVVLLAAALPAAAPPAAAQPAGADVEERRTRLFKEGKAAGDAGQWAEAADKFRQVVALRSAPKALIALGVAEEHLGHLVAAHAAYKQAREGAADKAMTDDLKTANAALEALRPRIPQIVFSPSDALNGADLQVDGNPAQASQGVLLLDPGAHRIHAVAPGKGDFRVKVTLNEGEQRQLTVEFQSSPPEGPTATAAPSGDADVPGTGSARPPTGALVIGALGVVAAGVGGALYGLGSAQYDKASKDCGGACTAEEASRGNAARVQLILADALFGAGGAALGGAAIWWIVSATSKKKPEEASVFIAPRPGGLTIGGRF